MQTPIYFGASMAMVDVIEQVMIQDPDRYEPHKREGMAHANPRTPARKKKDQR